MEDLDYYGILEVDIDATDKQVTKAYRMRALKCHPDKNPDNPEAVALFHRLSKAYEVLMDPSARKTYDTLVRARIEKLKRDEAIHGVRRKLKTDLEERELSAKKQKYDLRDAQERMEAELRRLQAEGARLQMEREKELFKATASFNSSRSSLGAQRPDIEDQVSSLDKTVKIKWSKKATFTSAELETILSTFGRISHLIASSKKPSAMVEFRSILAAHSVVSKCKTDEMLKQFECVEWAAGEEPAILKSFLSAPNDSETQATSGLSYETATLLRMSQAKVSMDRDALRKEKLRQAELERDLE